MSKYLFLYFCCLSSFFCSAENSNSNSRLLLHTINYISADYSSAVKDGKVLNQDEYNEQLEFIDQAAQLSNDFFSKKNPGLLSQCNTEISNIKKIIIQKGADSLLQKSIQNLRVEILKNIDFSLSPASYPDIAKGNLIYTTNCSRCHGKNGDGKGVDAPGMNPPPRDFTDTSKLNALSPFFIFNTVRLGIPGTSMVAHPELSDDQIWDVAFYVLQINSSQNPSSDSIKIPLDKISTYSNNELKTILNLSPSQVNFIRNFRPKISFEDAKSALDNALQQVIVLYNEGKYEEATQLANAVYFERIEALEAFLINNSEKKLKLEKHFFAFRNALSNSGNTSILKQEWKEINSVVESIHPVKDKNLNNWTLFFMSASIIFREALEAFLLLIILLSIINKTGMDVSRKYLHLGWVSALFIGVLSWMFLGDFISSHMKHVELMEGVFSLLSVVVLIFIGFWLHKKSDVQEWSTYIKNKMNDNLFSNNHFGIFALSFMIVFREVFESLLFLSTLQLQSADLGSSFIIFGAILSLAIIFILAWFVVRFSYKLPISSLFSFCKWMMAILAVILTGKGIHALQEAGLLSATQLSFPTVEWLGIYPYTESLVAQLLVLIFILFLKRKT